MKRLAGIIFSLVLIYGGVAWALASCLSHDDQHQHSLAERDSHLGGSTHVRDSQDSSRQVVHCPTAEVRIGPAAQSGSTHLSRGHQVATVPAPLFYQAASPTFRNSLWLDAVFRRESAFVRADNLGLHLLFSVLQV